MKPVREVVTRDVIDDLWGAGYTILPRRRHVDPFFVEPELIPQGRSYQWMHLVHDKFHYEHGGWASVPASRHDGYFMPAGHVGDIEVNGLGLFEKPKFEVERDQANHIAAAHKQVDDWKDKWGGEFSGEAKVGTETIEIGTNKTIENTTAIPRDMVPYIAQIFAERDYLTKLYAEDRENEHPVWSTLLIAKIAAQMDSAMEANSSAPIWPMLNAITLPFAIQNIRNRIKEESNNGD